MAKHFHAILNLIMHSLQVQTEDMSDACYDKVSFSLLLSAFDLLLQEDE